MEGAEGGYSAMRPVQALDTELTGALTWLVCFCLRGEPRRKADAASRRADGFHRKRGAFFSQKPRKRLGLDSRSQFTAVRPAGCGAPGTCVARGAHAGVGAGSALGREGYLGFSEWAKRSLGFYSFFGRYPLGLRETKRQASFLGFHIFETYPTERV